MERKPYIMKVEEIQTLIAGLITHGPEDIYGKIKAKAFFAMENKDDIDDMFLDMAETLLKKGREELEEDDEDGENPSIANIYYTLSYILRKVAHETYSKYLKLGKERDNNRFIRLVSYNKDAPLMV